MRPKSAGHVVKAGAELATLDDRDMRLEAQRWASQQQQYQKLSCKLTMFHTLQFGKYDRCYQHVDFLELCIGKQQPNLSQPLNERQ
jgi:hypothetical protein